MFLSTMYVILSNHFLKNFQEILKHYYINLNYFKEEHLVVEMCLIRLYNVDIINNNKKRYYTIVWLKI